MRSCHSSHHCTTLEKAIISLEYAMILSTTPTYFMLLVIVKAGWAPVEQHQEKICLQKFHSKIPGRFKGHQGSELELNSCMQLDKYFTFQSGKKNASMDEVPTLLNDSSHHRRVSPGEGFRHVLGVQIEVCTPAVYPSIFIDKTSFLSLSLFYIVYDPLNYVNHFLN
jgi:hypothetical protein